MSVELNKAAVLGFGHLVFRMTVVVGAPAFGRFR